MTYHSPTNFPLLPISLTPKPITFPFLRQPIAIVLVSSDGKLKEKKYISDLAEVIRILEVAFKTGHPIEMFIYPKQVVQQRVVTVDWKQL